LLLLLAAAVALGGLVLVYELGRFDGGYSILDQRRERTEYLDLIAEKEAEIENLNRRIAILETSQEIDQETYSQVEEDLDRLQARIQSQEEELAFYQGIISPEAGVAGLRVQSLKFRRGDADGSYLLHLVLVQAVTHDRRVSGDVRLSLTGLVNGESAEFSLADLATDEAGGDLAYAFRYFQDLQRELVLPAGFVPEEVIMEIRPREPAGAPRSQTFQWSAIVG
jgi:TolA-binding protein